MRVLLFGSSASGLVLPSEENIYNSACVHQVGEAAQYAR
jgi:hypothetical protein